MREELVRMGAYGFFSKVDELEELMAGLQEVAAGREFASCNVDSAAEERRMRARLHREGLSDRQATVLMLLAQGYMAKEAAEILGMSEHTLLAHKKRAVRKLRGRNIAEVASRLGLYW
jgi:DNA-binding NarL/FixJ family response regulator